MSLRAFSRQCISNSLWALVYAACAWLALNLAPSASYQSIFWPCAGLALAMVLLYGYGALLAVFMGGFFVYCLHAPIYHSPAGLVLFMALILVPVVQAGLGRYLINQYCSSDFWIFSDWRRLLRMVLAGGVLPAVFTSVSLLLALEFYSITNFNSGFYLGISVFIANSCSVAIVTPCTLLIILKNPLVTGYRKWRIVLPIMGLFGVAALCYGALYQQLRQQFEMEHRMQLDKNTLYLQQRITAVYQQLQTLRFFLMAYPDKIPQNFMAAAERAMAAQQAVANTPPYFAVSLVVANYLNNKVVDNYSIQDIYPVNAFGALKNLPLANDDDSFYVLMAASARTTIYTLPNLDLARTPAGSFVMILLHQLLPSDPSMLLAATVDITNLVFGLGAQDVGTYRAFRIEDVLSGRTLYQSYNATLFHNKNNVVYWQLVEFGDRSWRVAVVYDFLWLEFQLQRKLLYISMCALLFIALFTLLILSALVSAQVLEQAVNQQSQKLEDDRRFLDAIFESIPLFIFVKEVASRRYVRVNRQAERILGMPRSFFEGKTAYELFPEEEASRLTASDASALECLGILDVGEECSNTPMGRRWLYTRKALIRDGAGEPRYILGISEDITERRSQEQTLDSLVESLPLALLVCDANGLLVYVNSFAIKHLSKVAVGSSTLKDVFVRCHEGELARLLVRSSANKKPVLLVAEILDQTGDQLTVEAIFTQANWQNENCYIVLINDISERLRAQKIIRDSENQLRMLLANLGEGVCGVDHNGLVNYANQAAHNILGYATQSLLSVPFYSAVMAEQSLQDNPVTQAINLGQITRSESACFKAQDGRHICVEYVCTPLQGENSDSNGAVIVFSDITERIEYQTNLAKRNELISLGLDAAGLGSWEWIFEEKIIVWSPTLYRILDMSEGDFSGHLAELKKLIHPDDIEQIRLVDAHAKNSLDVTEFCCRIIKPKGDVIWVTGKYRYFANSQGLPVRARGVLWDSTDETLLQQDNISKTEALKRSNKELDSFAYIASHDLKEPLRGISNYATFLQEDYANVLDADGLGMLQSLVRLAGHMEQLINDLLNYSRLGRTELAYGDVDINAVVTGVLESLWPRLNELNVSVNYATPLPCVYCDSVRIAEVFRNLITNAMKYNDAENKTIALGCNLGAKEYVFYVRDNGIGIAPAFQQRIFEVFKRLHAKTEYGGGSGIGLSIVQKIVVQHGGRLWLESVLNKGTTFYFSLPHPTKN